MIGRWVNTGYNYGQAVRLQVCHVGNTDPVGKQLVLQGYTEKTKTFKARDGPGGPGHRWVTDGHLFD